MLADMVGTTRSRVSFFLSKFRKLGFSDNGGVHVHRSLLTIALHNQILLILAILARRQLQATTGSILAT